MFGSELNVVDLALVFSLASVFIATIIKFSCRIGMLDIPNNRSSHVAPTPRGGGVAMFLSYMIVLLFFHTGFLIEYIGFYLALITVFAVGVYDDNSGVSPKVKFIAIILASLLIFFISDFRIDTLGVWFGYEINLYWIFALILTIFAVVGFTNALNLLDGLDGLAGSVSLVIFVAFAYIGYIYNDTFISTVSILMIVALLGFLHFNWNPANIFMGDSGSLVFGFTIASVAIKSIDYISVTSILLITALPIIDTLVVMTRRLQRGLSPFNPDKTHIHHKILTWKGSVDHSVMILVTLQIVLSFIGVILREKGDEISFFLIVFIIYLFFNFLDERKLARDKIRLTKIKKRVASFIKDDLGHKRAFKVVSLTILFLFLVRVFLF